MLVFFDDEEDYRRGDEVLSAMPTDDTPGQRTGVAKYNVANPHVDAASKASLVG